MPDYVDFNPGSPPVCPLICHASAQFSSAQAELGKLSTKSTKPSVKPPWSPCIQPFIIPDREVSLHPLVDYGVTDAVDRSGRAVQLDL